VNGEYSSYAFKKNTTAETLFLHGVGSLPLALFKLKKKIYLLCFSRAEGIYARVRHPQYAGIFLITVGFLIQWKEALVGVVETFAIAWLSGATNAAIYNLGVKKE
jgi:hypothetical protein